MMMIETRPMMMLEDTSTKTELQAAQWLATERRRAIRLTISSMDRQLATMSKADACYWALARERDSYKDRYRVERRAYRRLMSA